MNKELDVIAIIPTPFNARGLIDRTALEAHLERILPINPVILVGGPGGGEISSLEPDEHDELLSYTIEKCAGRAPVQAMGFEPRTIKEMIRFIQRAEQFKPDACLVYALDPGHSAVPTNAETERYLSSVIEATSVPLIISSHSRTGHQVAPELIEKLVKRYPQRIRGVQWGGPNVFGLADVTVRLAGEVKIYCAGTPNIAAALCLGGDGFMGGEPNFAPLVAASIATSFQRGDMDEFRQSLRLYLQVAQLLIKAGASFRGKAMFDVFGLPGGGPHREPRMAPDGAVVDAVAAQIAALNIPGLPAPVSKERREACAAGRGFEN